MLDHDFSKQLEKTLKANERYSKEREKLKQMFFEKYDKITVTSLVELVIKNGHPPESDFMKQFNADYTSGNFDDVEIKEFNRLLKNYKEELFSILERGVK